MFIQRALVMCPTSRFFSYFQSTNIIAAIIISEVKVMGSFSLTKDCRKIRELWLSQPFG